jgi:hypothetical protein
VQESKYSLIEDKKHKISLKGLKETTRTSDRTINVPVDIRTENLPNTSQKRCSWIRLALLKAETSNWLSVSFRLLCCLVTISKLCFTGHRQTVSVTEDICRYERIQDRMLTNQQIYLTLNNFISFSSENVQRSADVVTVAVCTARRHWLSFSRVNGSVFLEKCYWSFVEL